MRLLWDAEKRQSTLLDRGLDFADAKLIFQGPTLTLEDDRRDYTEPRFQTYGLLDDRLVMMAWTPINGGVRVISMRKCNDREKRKFGNRLG